MHTLTNWTAKRSGPSLSITGTDRNTGKPVKLTGVAEITANGGGIRAIARDGTRHQLI